MARAAGLTVAPEPSAIEALQSASTTAATEASAVAGRDMLAVWTDTVFVPDLRFVEVLVGADVKPEFVDRESCRSARRLSTIH